MNTSRFLRAVAGSDDAISSLPVRPEERQQRVDVSVFDGAMSALTASSGDANVRC